MRRRLGSVNLTCLILAAGAGDIASAQESSPRLVDVTPCAAIRSDGQRLACFDRLVDATSGTTVTEPRTAPRPAGGDESASPRGRNTQRTVEAAEIVGETPVPPEPREIRSEVASVREILPGRLEITLTNGQVWRQTNSDRYMLQPGHEVRVYTSRFGRYWRLSSTTLRGFVQVERID